MHNEIFTREALQNGVDQLVGKPVVIYANGRRRVIGAKLDDARKSIAFTADITDEEAAGILGAAQDRNQATASPIGMSDAEIAGIVGTYEDDRWADDGGPVNA